MGEWAGGGTLGNKGEEFEPLKLSIMIKDHSEEKIFFRLPLAPAALMDFSREDNYLRGLELRGRQMIPKDAHR